MGATNGNSSGNGLAPGLRPAPMEGARAASDAGSSENSSLDQVLVAIRRRWHLIGVCVALVAGAALIFSLVQRNEYTASASLLFSNTQFDQELFGSNFITSSVDPTREAATNIDLVSLPTVAARTAAALHLPKELVESAVTVAGDGQADLARIEATDTSPVRAALIANTYSQQYVLFRQQADRSKIAGAQNLVRRELAALPSAQRDGSVGQSLENRASQLGVLAALQTGNAEVVQAASVPTSPSSPKTKRNGVLGVVLGMLLGLGLAFLAERLDRRVRDVSELEDAYGVPVLGAVLESASYSTAATEPLPPIEGEAFALLRARLRYFNVDREIRSLLVTSAIPGEGKTTVALNLALAEAVAGSPSVVLVEADLRRPALRQRLSIERRPGLAEILSRNATIDDALVHVEVPRRGDTNRSAAGFAIIPAGAIPPNPGELVESRAMIDLLSALSEQFDLVIIDSPPTSVVSDAIPLMRLVSGVVIVSRIDVTTRDATRHLREQLRKLRAPTLGVIANAVPLKNRGYYGYGYYGNGYEPARAENSVEPSRSPGRS
jgi:tyrosine-protein kinase